MTAYGNQGSPSALESKKKQYLQEVRMDGSIIQSATITQICTLLLEDDALKRQIKENEVAHNKELERAMDRKNRENLETSIRRMEFLESLSKDERREVTKQMHMDNLQNERQLRKQAKDKERLEKEAIRERWVRDREIQRTNQHQQLQMKDLQREELKRAYDKQHNLKLQNQMMERVEDVQHAAAYNARVNELDHISYRDYYQKYKKRVERMVTPNPITNVTDDEKKRLAQMMQIQGIKGNEARGQQELEKQQQLQRGYVAANIYNKERALRKKEELDKSRVSPTQNYKKARLGQQVSQDEFVKGRESLHYSIDYTPHRDISEDKYSGISPSPLLSGRQSEKLMNNELVGLPKRAKHAQGDQIYNYDSIYNVFGRHYTHRYVSKTPAPKFNFADNSSPSQQQILREYQTQRAPVQKRTGSLSPSRVAEQQAENEQKLIRYHGLQQPNSLEDERSQQNLKSSLQNQGGHLDSGMLRQINHQRSSTLDSSPPVKKMSQQELDAAVRNYQRIQDNLRSVRANKQLMTEYGVDKRPNDDRLAHYGQFLMKS